MAASTANSLADVLHSCLRRGAHHRPAKSILAQVLTAGFSGDTFLANRLVELFSHCRLFDHAAKLFNFISHPNVYSWNAAIAAHGKSGDLDLAQKLFDRMPDRNSVSYNTLIGAFARCGSEVRSLDLYYMMIGEGILPTHFTFASVLSVCRSTMRLEDGRKCHGFSVKIGLDTNIFVANALIGMYTKCGSIEFAVKVFNEMKSPNEVSFTSLMCGLKQIGGSTSDALRLFAKMHRNGIIIDDVSVSSALNICARTEEEEEEEGLVILNQSHTTHGYWQGLIVQSFVVKCGFEIDPHVGNSLLDFYVKHGDLLGAEKVFDTLHYPNIVSFNVLIAGYGQLGDSSKAITLLHKMRESGCEPDNITYVSMLGACVKNSNLEAARRIFESIHEPCVSSWNAILSGYCQEESYDEAFCLFRRMQFRGICLDRTTSAVILSACSSTISISFGRQVHGASTKAMLHFDVFVASGLIDMYSKSGDVASATRIFDGLQERDVVTWNSMISGFSLHSLSEEAFNFYNGMRAEGMLPSASTYASMASSCAKSASLRHGRQVHALVAKEGFGRDVFVGSSLIDMYGKCGNIDSAYNYFREMPLKNVVSWNEMIHGFAQNGYAEKALELFGQMLNSQERPDSVTFIGVLTACGHSGLVNEGINFFNSMEEEHGIKPLVDHYTCVIDLLGRSGRLTEAESLIVSMSWKNDSIVWEVLLGACVVHGNADVGRKAAEELFRLDPNNPSPYVLLSNIYAKLGRWGEMWDVRARMSSQGVFKDRGYSWVDRKCGRVHAFMVDDSCSLN